MGKATQMINSAHVNDERHNNSLRDNSCTITRASVCDDDGDDGDDDERYVQGTRTEKQNAQVEKLFG
jgi:hypothetical protein